MEPDVSMSTEAPTRVLVVGDKDDHDTLEALVTGMGYQPLSARDAAQAIGVAQETAAIDAVLADVQMLGMDGITLCAKLREILPNTPVILLTGHGSVESVVHAMRAGAFDYHTRPVNTELLALSMERALEHRRLKGQLRRLEEAVVRAQPPGALLGTSPAMRAVVDLIVRVAATDATVLIEGESGTGKELVARAVHDYSARRACPFVAINCAAVPSQLLESELFGHARGAFTDARVARAGLFIEAQGGTLFLDEIGDMPLSMQVKLLRALQERTLRPVGSDRELPFDVRIVAATNRDLEQEMKAQRFREDLYYRVAVVGIHVPTLRERPLDIPMLALHFVRRFAERFGRKVVGISPDTLKRLLAYEWPGNVRELENSMERAVALTRFDHLTPEDLPERVRAAEVSTAACLPESGEPLVSLAELERRYIQQVLDRVGGNKTHAARILGVDRRTLYRIFDRERAPDDLDPH
jgi:DNA-binding NtrC family response regulator